MKRPSWFSDHTSTCTCARCKQARLDEALATLTKTAPRPEFQRNEPWDFGAPILGYRLGHYIVRVDVLIIAILVTVFLIGFTLSLVEPWRLEMMDLLGIQPDSTAAPCSITRIGTQPFPQSLAHMLTAADSANRTRGCEVSEY